MRYKISIGVDAIAMMALAVRCIALPSGTSSISRASLNTSHATNSTRAAGESLPQPALLATQDECGTAEVVAGDSCESVAKKCDASPEELLQYNPSEDFCATLEIGQIVCCSPGNLPELGPRPQADGTCASHTVAPLEPCDTIARDNHITVQDVEAYNLNTWRFMGCDNLQAGQIICLSLGAAPMPATDPNAICGPQVNGTRKPMDVDVDLAQLNPCPLNGECFQIAQSVLYGLANRPRSMLQQLGSMRQYRRILHGERLPIPRTRCHCTGWHKLHLQLRHGYHQGRSGGRTIHDRLFRRLCRRSLLPGLGAYPDSD